MELLDLAAAAEKIAAAASTTAAAMAAEAMMIIAKYDLDCAVCTSNDGLRAFYAEAI